MNQASETYRPKVVAVAVQYQHGLIVSMPPPARHSDVVYAMTRFKGGGAPTVDVTQGFLLSDGTFANRKQARVCAELNNQLLPRACALKELYSEDLW